MRAVSFALNHNFGPFFLAPVAGYSDIAFRAICAQKGAALCYTEMVSAEALVRGHKKQSFCLSAMNANPIMPFNSLALILR